MLIKKTSILAVAAIVFSCSLLAGCDGTTVVNNHYHWHRHHGWHHWHHHHCHHHWC